MDTCLETLWELIRTPVSKIIQKGDTSRKKNALVEKSEAAYETTKLIHAFFSELGGGNELMIQIEMPEHIGLFTKGLNEFEIKSINGVIEGARLAKGVADKCGLCAVCRKCSHKFYDGIIEQSTAEKSLPYELENYFVMPAQMHYYKQSMHYANEKFALENRLLCLKGFSSSTPTIQSIAFEVDCMGGGIYLNYFGIGIVIDPGIGFVNSMHKQGIYINNIDVVIISHDHLDHNADAEVITSLLHDLNSYNKRKNAIVKEFFGIDTNTEHNIVWIVDGDSKTKLSKKVKDIKLLSGYLNKKKQILKGNKNIRLSAIRTKHIKDSKETYGIMLYLNYDKTINIGYTSDTAYFSELISFFSMSDIMIFNVSDIYKKDVKGIQDKHSHLGYNGSLKLLKQLSTRLAIASEFCCTNGDFRIPFINALSKELTTDKRVIIGEIGLNISIPQIEIECSFCKRMVPMIEISMVSPRKEYGKILYSCRQCTKNVI